MFLSLLACASDSDTKCFCFQSGRQDNPSHTKLTCWGTLRAGRSALFTFTAASTPRSPPEPAMTSFDQASSSKRRLSASCGQMCSPHTQRSWAQFINPLLPVLTASSLLTNASLDRCSLTQFRGREVTGHLLNDTRSMKCHHPQTKEADRPPARVLFLFAEQHQADEVRLLYQQIQGNPRGDAFPFPIHRGQTPLWVTQALFFLARVDIFV